MDCAETLLQMASPYPTFDYDWIVVGSGFGGSVAALRLAEKGYRVAVLEAGRRFRDEDFPGTGWNRRGLYRVTALGMAGPMRLTLTRDLFIATGAGVGGGSLVYGNTLFRPRPSFFENPQWASMQDWAALLEPHYATAERMLGCRDRARHTLAKNYLWFAERAGATIVPETKVTHLRSLDGMAGNEGYLVQAKRSTAWFGGTDRTFRARGVVIAAGALGTNLLLAQCRLLGGLPNVSPRLGQLVRTNTESTPAVKQPPDHALSFAAKRGLFGGVRLTMKQDPGRPDPTFNCATANDPFTTHILGGAVIGRDADSGVVDRDGRVFGYHHLIICDGSILPANPGVNPSLTITALAEHIMTTVPAKPAD